MIMGTSTASPGQNVLKETFWESLDWKGKKSERDRNRDKIQIKMRTRTEKDLMLTAWTITYNDYEVIFLLLFATKFLWIINIKQLELKIRMIRFLRISADLDNFILI